MAMTDENKRNLIGSESRDKFKRFHKQGPKEFYACDTDLALVSKVPPGVVAILDYKPQIGNCAVTFSEVIAYNDWLDKGYDVYLIVSPEPETWEGFLDQRFDIYAYHGGDSRPNPPQVNIELIQEQISADELWNWEREIRREWARKCTEAMSAETIADTLRSIAEFVEKKFVIN